MKDTAQRKILHNFNKVAATWSRINHTLHELFWPRINNRHTMYVAQWPTYVHVHVCMYFVYNALVQYLWQVLCSQLGLAALGSVWWRVHVMSAPSLGPPRFCAVAVNMHGSITVVLSEVNML